MGPLAFSFAQIPRLFASPKMHCREYFALVVMVFVVSVAVLSVVATTIARIAAATAVQRLPEDPWLQLMQVVVVVE